MSIRNVLIKLNSRDTHLFPSLSRITKKSKIILFAIIFVFASFFSFKILAADLSPTAQKYNDKQKAIEKGNNQESWMNEAMASNAMSLSQAIGGTIPTDVLKGLKTAWVPGGIIGLTNNAIASLYNPPASGIQYIADTFNNFLGKPAYAQSTGFNGLKGILPIWKSFRNAVYILISVIFIGIGIGIMLRIKISQQAVITIQSAIPQLITSLILVTFSYAIAGLLIDLTYLIQGIILSIIFNGNTSILNDSTLTLPNLMTANWGVVNNLAMKNIPMGAIFGLLTGIIGATVGAAIGISAGAAAVASAGAAVGAAATATAIWPIIGIGVVALALIMLIVYIVLLMYIIKFFFGMVKCYINIILRIILAPLEIGMGAIPNSKSNFSSWIWNLVANLAVFPVAIIFLVLVNVIIEAVRGGNLWHPPMAGGITLLVPALGFSGLMILAKLPTLVPEAIFQIKPSPFGKAIGEGFSPISKGLGEMAEGGGRYGVNSIGKKWTKDGENQTGMRGAKYKIGTALTYLTSKHH